MVAGELEGAASAELPPSLFTPSWENGFCAVVVELVEGFGAEEAAAAGAAVVASGGGCLGVEEAGEEDEEGFGASDLSWSGFGAEAAGFPSFARRLARI